MDTQTQNQIAEYYAKLPPGVQTMFSSMEWMKTLRTISETHKFSRTQNETIGTETTLVLLGMISLEEYKEALFNELNIDKDIFEKVTEEIEEKVIKPVRAELIKTHQKNKTDLVIEKYGTKLDERFSKLSPEIKEAILSTDYQNTIVSIGQKEKLTTEQLGKLEEEVTKIMLGTEHQNDFRSNLKERLGLEDEKVGAIITAVNGNIFAPIRDFYKEEVMSETLVDKKETLKDNLVDLKETSHEDSSKSIEGASVEKKDLETLARAGVEDLNNDTVVPFSNNINEKKDVELPDRNSLMNDIENPTKDISFEKDRSFGQNKEVEKEMSFNGDIENAVNINIVDTNKQDKVVVKSATPSFLENKLGQPTISTSETTDHSLPGMSTNSEILTPPIKESKSDPYLEPID